jgi:exonuclease SbcC
MIKELFIKNFQSHKRTELEFDPGVNIIIGSSDSGKTAILRAIRWLVYNRPTGDSFRSNWGGETKVTLFTDDAHIIRVRDKDNKYILGDSNFEAVKTDVPKEVQNALNLSNINLQQQLDPPFLLSDTPGAVAQHFNKVANLDKIDLGLQNVNRWISQISKVLEFKREEKKRQQELLTQFNYLEEFETEVEVLEGMDKTLKQLRSRSNTLQELIYDIELVSTDIKDKSKVLQLKEPVENLLGLYKEVKDLKLEQMRLAKVIDNVEGVKDKLIRAKAKHEALLSKFQKSFPSVCPLCGQKVKKI